MEEVHMVVRVARRYHQFKLNFCIITFYDPQRAAIIKALENAGLPSERVHNVDSFQDRCQLLVLVLLFPTSLADIKSSLVRERSGLCNLCLRSYTAARILESAASRERSFDRCGKGMVVVTNKCFLRGAGRSTLLGQLCRTWPRHHDACWIDWKVMLNNATALSGLSLPSLPPSPSHLQNWRTTMAPSNSLSQTQTHQASLSTLAGPTLGSAKGNVIGSWRRTTAAATVLVRPSYSDSWRRGGSG